MSNQRIRLVIGVLLLLAVATVASSDSLNDVIDGLKESTRSQLLVNHTVHRDLDSWRDVTLLPDHPFSTRIQESLADSRPNVLSERLTLVPKHTTDTEFLTLYNSLRRVSTFDEIDYYNVQKDKWNPLFDGSYRVATPESSQALPDPVVNRIPKEDSIYVRQGLPPFGPAVSSYQYRHKEGAILFSAHNLTRITYKGFPVVGPREMTTHFLLIRGADYLLVYGVGGADVFNLFGLLSGKIENPFENRTTGLFDWYNDEYLQPLRGGAAQSENGSPPPSS